MWRTDTDPQRAASCPRSLCSRAVGGGRPPLSQQSPQLSSCFLIKGFPARSWFPLQMTVVLFLDADTTSRWVFDIFLDTQEFWEFPARDCPGCFVTQTPTLLDDVRLPVLIDPLLVQTGPWRPGGASPSDPLLLHLGNL